MIHTTVYVFYLYWPLAVANGRNVHFYITTVSIGFIQIQPSVTHQREPHIIRVGVPGMLRICTNCYVLFVSLVAFLGVKLKS